MHSTSPLNPSQAVERIREIIVGRHLERLEQRIAKLEAPASRQTATDLTPLEDRILASEARLEALHSHVTRLTETHREENERRTHIQREETQRLAAQIQQVAATRMAASASSQDISGLERKLGAWLGDWQKSLSQHLEAREQKITEKLHAELTQLWENIESQLKKFQSRTPDTAAIEQRFNKIAEAARALAECAASPLENPASPLMPAILTPLPSPDPNAVSQQKPTPQPLAPLLFSTFVPPEESKRVQPSVQGLSALPSWAAYAELEATDFPSCWPKPLSLLPAMDEATPPPFIPVASLIPEEEEQAAAAAIHESAESLPADYTDEDLFQAFAPIIENALRNSLDGHRSGIDPQLEPMLRATIRRALAEYSPGQRPFRAPGSFDRFLWRTQALFSSRSYDEIVFEKTHRFQVEEVFLLDAKTLALISFASCDPARHSSAHRVQGTLQRLVLQLHGEEGELRTRFSISEQRTVVSRKGGKTILMAIVRGPSNELILSDLDFSVRRIEERFREQLDTEGTPLLQTLQPFLEDCLLIQAPASAA